MSRYTYPSLEWDMSRQLNRQDDKSRGYVHASYICNRCKGKGHLVMDCPTNEDAAYDITAGADYMCRHCKEKGTHYSKFCPKDPSPDSMYNRRQARNHVASLPQNGRYRGLDGRYDPPWKFSPPQTSSRITTIGDFMSTGSESKGILQQHQPQQSWSSDKITRLMSRQGLQSLNVKEGEVDSSQDRMEDFSMKDLNGAVQRRGPSEVTEEEEKQLHLFPFNSQSSHLKGGASRPYDRDPGENFWVPVAPANGKMACRRQENNLQREEMKSMSMHAPAIGPVPHLQSKAPPSSCDEFLSKLFANVPSQSRNKFRRRVTALEMWDRFDERKRQENENLEVKASNTTLQMLSADANNLSKARTGTKQKRGSRKLSERELDQQGLHLGEETSDGDMKDVSQPSQK